MTSKPLANRLRILVATCLLTPLGLVAADDELADDWDDIMAADDQTEVQSWPGDQKDILFAWRNADWENNPVIAFDKTDKAIQDYTIKEFGHARLGRHYEMIIVNGGFKANNIGQHIVTAINKSRAFSLEFLLQQTEQSSNQTNSIIALLSKDHQPAFAVTQQRNGLIFAIRRKLANDSSGMISLPLPNPATNKPVHLGLSCDEKNLTLYVNGDKKQVLPIPGTFAALSGRTLIFGSTDNHNAGWHGRLEAVAVYGKPIEAETVSRNNLNLQTQIASRQQSPSLVVQGILKERSVIPNPKSMPYRKALALFKYAVKSVRKGSMKDREVYVHHWVIMDKKKLPIAYRPLNKIYQLQLEPFEQHPQLTSECQSDTLDYDEPIIYYDISE